MKIVEVHTLALVDVKVVKFARFSDHRGYFTEIFRRSDFDNHPDTGFLQGVEFVQCNESFSKAGTVRGLHFQWNPYMGKLVRTIQGRMIDLALDIRKGSPNFGKIIAYDMPANPSDDSGKWIWLPPGFAHGNCFTEDTTIEYYCSGSYNPECEASISPLADDLDWSLCDKALQVEVQQISSGTALISDKDKAGQSLSEWARDTRSDNFQFGNC